MIANLKLQNGGNLKANNETFIYTWMKVFPHIYQCMCKVDILYILNMVYVTLDIPQLILWRFAGVWSRSQLTMGSPSVYLRTYRDRQLFTFTLLGNLVSPRNLTCMSLEGGKPMQAQGEHATSIQKHPRWSEPWSFLLWGNSANQCITLHPTKKLRQISGPS